jgi:hypothetical protein
MEDDEWKIDKKTAICMLDEDHTLYVTREEYGIHLKVEKNGDKPKTLFIKRIENDQLGHTLTKRKYE